MLGQILTMVRKWSMADSYFQCTYQFALGQAQGKAK